MATQERRPPDGLPQREASGVCPTCSAPRPTFNGAHFRMVRRLANGTQEQVADRLGRSVGHVSQIERGIRPFLQKHADVYDDLFGRAAAPQPPGRSPRHGRA